MAKLVGIVGRNIFSFLAILAVLVLGATVWNFAQGTFRFDRASVEEMQGMRSQVATDLQGFKEVGLKQAEERLAKARKSSIKEIEQRLLEVRAQSAQLSMEIDQFEKTGMTLALVTGNTDAISKHYKSKVDLEIARLEIELLEGVKAEQSAAFSNLGTAIESLNKEKPTLQKAREQHKSAIEAYQNAKNALENFEEQLGGAFELCRKHLFDGGCGPEHNLLLDDVSQAKKNLNESTVNLSKIVVDTSQKIQNKKQAAEKLAQLQSKIVGTTKQLSTNLAQLEESIDKEANRWERKVRKALPIAFGIWLGLVLLPIVLKMLGYFVFAPLAQRLKPVQVLKGENGSLMVGGRVPQSVADGAVSKVSVPVQVGANEELLIHPDYLQSTGNAGAKGTQWLLNWRYPLTSLAAGLAMLTRIRPAPGEPVVVSSRKDPFSEVGLITIPEGSAAVIQPRCLAGIVQQRDRPLRITSHWRLGTLHAWLTWQMRFLVFHGPVTVIAKGTRGVRIEPAGSGRSINQSATIGFSAGVGYSVRRCETFISYLRGEQDLFNDTLSGGRGYYIYEEMPAPEHRKSLAGRGIEGFVDAGMKVFGV